MTSRRLASRLALIAGGAALVAMGTLTAGCGTSTKEEPTTTPTTEPTSAPVVSPSEKAVGPDVDYSFSPSVNPKPPGAVCREIVNGVCIR